MNSTNDSFRIWEGISEDFPAEDPEGLFSSNTWIDKLAEEAQVQFAAMEKPGSTLNIPDAALIHEYPLPIIASMAAAELRRPVRILDFGGGLAASYLPVVSSLPRCERVDFHVVERPALSARGRELFGSISNLHFHDELPDTPQSFDIVHAGSSMQYVRDWRGTMVSLTKYAPRWLVFSNLLAGTIPTFVTHQTAYGKKVPVRFLNLNEFLGETEALGYRVIYHGLMIRLIFGEFQPLPTDHFPPEYRLRHGCNLVLVQQRPEELRHYDRSLP